MGTEEHENQPTGDVEEVPNPEPEVLTPKPETVKVACAGCGTQYEFEIEPRTESFKFDCPRCQTRSQWTRG